MTGVQRAIRRLAISREWIAIRIHDFGGEASRACVDSDHACIRFGRDACAEFAAPARMQTMTHRNARSAYQEVAGVKLVEIQAKVYIIRAVLKNEIAKGSGSDSEQLRLSRKQVGHFMSAVQKSLDDLIAAEDENWDVAKDSFDSAWEDVANAIRKAVARF